VSSGKEDQSNFLFGSVTADPDRISVGRGLRYRSALVIHYVRRCYAILPTACLYVIIDV